MAMVQDFEVEFTIRGEREKLTIEGEDLLSAAKRAKVRIGFSYPMEQFEIVSITSAAGPTIAPNAEQIFHEWDPLDALTMIAEALHEYAPPPIHDEFGREVQNVDADDDRRKAIYISLAALLSAGVNLPDHLTEEYETLSTGFYPIYFGLDSETAPYVEPSEALQHVTLALCYSWHPPKNGLYERFDDNVVQFEKNALAFGFLMAVGTLDGSGGDSDQIYQKVYENLLPLYLEANPSEPFISPSGNSRSLPSP